MQNKKLQYLTRYFTSDFIQENYPEFYQLVTTYFKYLDDNQFGKSIKITDNSDTNKIFDELLSAYYAQYFGSTIDATRYEVTDDNKRLFIELSKLINNHKGLKTLYDFLFSYMEDIRVALPNGTETTIDNVTYSLTEDAAFRYTLTVNQPLYKLLKLLIDLNPAGYLMQVDSTYVVPFVTDEYGLSSGFAPKLRYYFDELSFTTSSYYKISTGFTAKMRYGFETL
jgi:hypothetical protein